MSVDVRHIEVLSVALRNQIAAGEVVERPASALKELVENSLDAKARQIEVTLENGGQQYLRVQDDGIGICASELPLAVTRHATSKLRSFSDLEQLVTMGFRGEALPSIAQVSQFVLTSAQGGRAATLEVDFGKVKEVQPAVLSCGTCVEVRNLFGNVPARLKFLKSPATESKRAQEMLLRIALANLSVGFRLKMGARETLAFNANESLETRLATLWPEKILEGLRPVDYTTSGIHIHGLASIPQVTQLKGNRIFLYVNRRSVQDKRLFAAVREAYQGRLTSRDYPQAVLFIEIDPREVDVNVHPAKTEVRFRDEASLFRACVTALRSMLEQQSLTKPYEQEDAQLHVSACAKEEQPMRPEGFWGSLEEERPFWEREEPTHQGSWLFSEKSSPKEAQAQEPKSSCTAEPKAEREEPLSHTPEQASLEPKAEREDPLPHTPEQASFNEPKEGQMGQKPLSVHGLTYLGQIAQTYLLLRDTNEDLLVLDQHAAHERVLYGRLIQGRCGSEGQGLLIPCEMHLNSAEQELYFELRATIAKLGYQCTLAGATLVLEAIPPVLSVAEAKDVLRDIVSGSLKNFEAMCQSMACKGAIKAGQVLTRADVATLLTQWLGTKDHEFCPHGRPSVLKFDAAWFEKAFKRKE